MNRQQHTTLSTLQRHFVRLLVGQDPDLRAEAPRFAQREDGLFGQNAWWQVHQWPKPPNQGLSLRTA